MISVVFNSLLATDDRGSVWSVLWWVKAVIRFALFCAALLWLAACSPKTNIERATEITSEATDALRAGRYDKAASLVPKIEEQVRKPTADCASAMRGQAIGTSLVGFSEAIDFARAQDSVSAAFKLLSPDNAPVYWPRRPPGCQYQAVESSDVELLAASTVIGLITKACDLVANKGPDSDFIWDSVGGKIAFECQTTVRMAAKSDRTDRSGKLLSCTGFTTGSNLPLSEYQRDVARLGRPANITASRNGFSARWLNGYEFDILGNPNLIRRSTGAESYKKNDVRERIIVNDVNLKDIQANADLVDQLENLFCLSRSELSQVTGMEARGTAEEAADDLACVGLAEKVCDSLTRMARRRGASVAAMLSPETNYGYTPEEVSEWQRHGLSPAEARSAEAAICMQNGNC